VQNFKVAVLGGGCWGTTLAILLFEKGFEVRLWELFEQKVEALKKRRENVLLPGITIPKEILITDDLEEVIYGVDVVVIAVPSQGMRALIERLSKLMKEVPYIVSATKGLEVGTHLRMSEVIFDVLSWEIKGKVSVLGGPSHAEEVSRRTPTAVVVSSYNEQTARFTQCLFNTSRFRVYTNPDVAGVELGGALKNIIALAVGIADGLGFGDNTRAALITRGLAEMVRLGVALGGERETFSGLAGIGDLIVTCTSSLSRNRGVGEAIGRGRKVDEVLRELKMVAEGVPTTKAAFTIGKEMGLEIPITQEVYAVLFDGKDPMEAVDDLMLREMKSELEEQKLAKLKGGG
jgi:glycerol-3-phosphate dehydrogenase (NAD(P)+)